MVFVQQETAYEMRISGWSSDVCSSDLTFRFFVKPQGSDVLHARVVDSEDKVFEQSWPIEVALLVMRSVRMRGTVLLAGLLLALTLSAAAADRKSVVSGKSVSVRVVLGGLRITKKKRHKPTTIQH